MLKTIWQKIKRNHFLMMAVCCLAPVALVFGTRFIFKNGANWAWIMILLCPIAHIFMMKGHGSGDSEHCDKENKKQKVETKQ